MIFQHPNCASSAILLSRSTLFTKTGFSNNSITHATARRNRRFSAVERSNITMLWTKNHNTVGAKRRDAQRRDAQKGGTRKKGITHVNHNACRRKKYPPDRRKSPHQKKEISAPNTPGQRRSQNYTSEVLRLFGGKTPLQNRCHSLPR